MTKIQAHDDFGEILDIAPNIYQGAMMPDTRIEYELCGIIAHEGEKLDGNSRFVTYARGYQERIKKAVWYRCCDDQVVPVQDSTVFQVQAYILVYEKKDFTWGEYAQSYEV